MARTIADIKTSIVSAIQNDTTLSALTSTSNVADWNLWAYIVAVAQWTIEKLFDAHVSEVQGLLATQKPHTLKWYVSIARAFQYGAALPTDSDVYDNTERTDEQVSAMQIINYASATETGTGLRIKVATLSGNELAPLNDTQLTSFAAYMNLVKDAGVRLNITSGDADRFVTAVIVYYDPLVLDSNGQRLDGTVNTPVQDAIVAFLNKLPFNGLFVLNNYIAALQSVPGVVIADVTSAQATYGALPLQNISYQYLPDAGYLDINLSNDLTLNFIAHEPI